jgi:hypothetical protein
MSALRNPKLEHVAQELAAMRGAEEASRTAGYPDGSSFVSNARKRACRADVQRRVAELRAPEEQRRIDGVRTTREWLLAKCASIAGRDLGLEALKVSDQIAALKLMAQIEGWIAPERHDVGGTITLEMLVNASYQAAREKLIEQKPE